MTAPRAAATGVMPTWQCPHCGARQTESGRCWVCHRSTTCCATCANFRTSLVGGVGYCALDRSRSPLRGDEMRGCWEARAGAPATAPLTLTLGLGSRPVDAQERGPASGRQSRTSPAPPRVARDWVPVEELDRPEV